MSMFLSKPYSVSELCQKWQDQLINPLHKEIDYAALRAIVTLIQGKSKRDALRILKEYCESNEPMSPAASWARLSKVNLIYPR